MLVDTVTRRHMTSYNHGGADGPPTAMLLPVSERRNYGNGAGSHLTHKSKHGSGGRERRLAMTKF